LATDKPLNIVWISFEDTTPRFGCYGDEVAQTPHVDRLAAEGCRYPNNFSTAPVCAPARAAIITGMYPTFIGAHHMRTTHRGRPESALPTPYGTFYAPNISPDRTHGIGGWTDRQFADAMLRGLSPDGGHYYPAFPYDSYARMTARDVNDLRAYLAGLPPVARADVLHVLRFPYDNRRMLGLWKRRYLRHGPVVDAKGDAQVARGQYLVEGPGHCGSCHTPRTALGGPDYRRWLGGADEAPNITPGSGFIAEAGADEIVDALAPAKTHAQSGSYGEEMEAVRRNLAHLSDADRRAIAAYLKAILAVPDAE